MSRVDSTSCSIALRGVTFSYPLGEGGLHNVLKDLSLSILPGQIVGLLGRNASGKSTLLRLMRGELVPSHGEVRVEGVTVTRDGKRLAHPRVPLVSQQPGAFLAPSMTVYENWCLVQRSPALHWAYSRVSESACRETLSRARMGFENKLSEQTRFLSAGQQQALAVLLGLQMGSRIILLDEPTASLDIIAARDILCLTVAEARERGAAVLLVSQRPRDIVEFCERALVLRGGQVVLDRDLHADSSAERELIGALAE